MSPPSFNSLDVVLERWSDRLNPVLVKEVRQVLKSRSFAATFLVMLALTFAASLVLVAQAGNRLQFGEPGATFFGVYVTVLMLALCFVVPNSTFRSVTAEFEHRTFESLAVTTLTAQRIVFGKLQGAFVQMAAYYSAVAPFVCFTYLLGGVSVPGVVLALAITLLSSLTACLGGLMLGSLSRGGTGEVVTSLVLGIWTIIVFAAGTMMSTRVAAVGVGWDGIASLVAGFACLCYAGLFYGMLTLGVAISQFTPSLATAHSQSALEQRRRLKLQPTIIAARKRSRDEPTSVTPEGDGGDESPQPHDAMTDGPAPLAKQAESSKN